MEIEKKAEEIIKEIERNMLYMLYKYESFTPAEEIIKEMEGTKKEIKEKLNKLKEIKEKLNKLKESFNKLKKLNEELGRKNKMVDSGKAEEIKEAFEEIEKKEDLNKDIHILNLLTECLNPSTSWEQTQGIIRNCELINKDNIYLIIIKEKFNKLEKLFIKFKKLTEEQG